MNLKLKNWLISLAIVSPLVSAEGLVNVYKDPNCGCCSAWVDHMVSKGFEIKSHNTQNMTAVKAMYGVDASVSSCHTGITEGGYVVEGHVPARYLEQFLANPPEGAIGLSVPAMPVGTPGMEMGDRFDPYQVVTIMKDGQHQVFAEVNSAQQQ